MNSNIKETLRAEFEKLRQEIVAKYEASGRGATGNWGETVQVQELPNGFTVVADGYINGRGPGKAPPSEAIERWIEQKGIAARLQGEISTASLAYLIARKIAREGWKPKEGVENLLGNIVTPQRIQQLLDAVTPLYIQDFTSNILAYLNTPLS